jgi:ribosomal protein S18 acetylase RimI-like enzyme
MSVVTLEEYTVRTWPCLESLSYDGWVLRFAAGFTGRANAVYPLYRSSYDLKRKIDYCEEQYTQRGLPTRFKINPHSQPPGLDSVLEGLGYVKESPSLVMTRDSGDAVMSDPKVVVSDSYSDDWVDVYLTCNPARADHRDVLRALLREPGGQRLFATVVRDGQPVGAGLILTTRGAAGLYNVATHPDFRGQGIGRAISQTMVAIAAERVPLMFLQVEADNQPALRIYSGLGFATAFEYHYRVKPIAQP